MGLRHRQRTLPYPHRPSLPFPPALTRLPAVPLPRRPALRHLVLRPLHKPNCRRRGRPLRLQLRPNNRRRRAGGHLPRVRQRRLGLGLHHRRHERWRQEQPHALARRRRARRRHRRRVRQHDRRAPRRGARAPRAVDRAPERECHAACGPARPGERQRARGRTVRGCEPERVVAVHDREGAWGLPCRRAV